MTKKNQNPQPNIIEIDVAEKSLGRIASQIASLLMDKNNPNFAPYKIGNNIVKIMNADKVKLTGNKLQNKKYYRHSGYPGSLKEIPLKKLFEKNPQDVLRQAIYGMLPKNKLRDQRIKKVQFINK
jgi:large subunit ribosomal protein L13